MAHKVMIDGTLYDIQGGKTMVDGTVYDIQGGRTMVDGTARDISFGTVHRVTVTLDSSTGGYSNKYGSGYYASVDGVNLEASTDGTVNEVKSDGTLALKVHVGALASGGEANLYSYIRVDGTIVKRGSGDYTLNTEAENISVVFSVDRACAYATITTN